MENLNMAQQNKVAVNLAQDFTDEQKLQGRQNIDASQISYNSTVTDMTVTKEVVRPYMNTKYSATVGSDSFLLLPSTFADGMVVKSNGSLQTQSIPTVKNTHYISYINNPGSLSVDAYNEMTDAITNSEPVVIISATGSNSSYLQLTRYDSSGHYFTGYNSADGSIIEMYIAGTRAVTITTRKTGLPAVTHYSASWGNAWTSMRQLDSSISSGNIFKTVTLDTPITLSANKRYMISPVGITGNVEQTKTIAHMVNNSYRLAMWLYDSNQNRFLGTTAVILATAEIANHHTVALGDYPPVGGKYQASFNSCSSIIEPAVNLSLDTLATINSGNIDWGFDSSHPALLLFNHRIDGIDVMEIQ